MKTSLVGTLIAFFLVSSCVGETEIDSILGVWNLGSPRDAVYIASTHEGLFLRTGTFLKIDRDSNGEASIVFDGGSYKIVSWSSSGGELQLVLEYTTTIEDSKGNWNDVKLRGVVEVHIVNSNRIWFLVCLQNKITDSRFPQSDFSGPAKVYWRAKKYPKNDDLPTLRHP